MAVFNAGGQEWQVRLTLGLVGRLRTDADFRLGKSMEAGNLAESLFFDPERLGAVLWVLCREEAEQRGMTQEAFFGLLDGDSLEAAGAAVVDAIVSFFQAGRATAIKPKLPGLIQRMNTAAGKAAVAEIEKTLKSLDGDSPVSSGSTPLG